MNSLHTIQKLSRMGKMLSKTAFIVSLIGFCGCLAGLLSLGSGRGSLIRIGGVSLHGLLGDHSGRSIESLIAAFSGWLIVCAGEAVLARFAEGYFRNELKAGTPFTLAGAKEMLRLGILTLTIPTGCAAVGRIAEGILAGFAETEAAETMDTYFDTGANLALGIMFLFVSLLCRCGAELTQRDGTQCRPQS